MANEQFDVIIVGAGLSGIGAARHLQEKCPDRRIAILEERAAVGGTWDLFRYPGIRSDSDMYTLGYNFKPWKEGKAIADGPAILNYIREAATETGIEDKIRYQQKVTSASWSSKTADWTVTTENTDSGETTTLGCNFLMLCSGYYNYEHGYLPDFRNLDQYQGQFVHPQHWPADLDCSGKKVVVVGSGATAVTLIPELAKQAAEVVMLQRSPTYMASLPDVDWIARFLQWLLPEKRAYAIIRWKNIQFQRFIYWRSRKAPEQVKKKLLKMARKEVGKDVDFDQHFIPRYNPWDQRLCLVPNGDFFDAIRERRAAIVTDTIDSFTEDGIRLDSGETLNADIVVLATGLELKVFGDIALSIDGNAVNVADTYSYKAMMLSGVPNLVSIFGYINASWTLKADLTAEYTCRLLNYMAETGSKQCMPELPDDERAMGSRDWIETFSSGYIQRRMHLLPRQGHTGPWINTQNYVQDRKTIHDEPLDDGLLIFSKPVEG